MAHSNGQQNTENEENTEKGWQKPALQQKTIDNDDDDDDCDDDDDDDDDAFPDTM